MAPDFETATQNTTYRSPSIFLESERPPVSPSTSIPTALRCSTDDFPLPTPNVTLSVAISVRPLPVQEQTIVQPVPDAQSGIDSSECWCQFGCQVNQNRNKSILVRAQSSQGILRPDEIQSPPNGFRNNAVQSVPSGWSASQARFANVPSQLSPQVPSLRHATPRSCNRGYAANDGERADCRKQLWLNSEVPTRCH